MRLREQGLWDDDRPLWGEHGWNVYLESVAAVERAIRYVGDNPLKEGKKRQNWSFVVPFVERRSDPHRDRRGGDPRPKTRRGASAARR